MTIQSQASTKDKFPSFLKPTLGIFFSHVTLAFLLYLILTIILTYPLIRHMGSSIPSDLGDPILNTWILWWNASASPFSSEWWNAPAFYPLNNTLAFSEHLSGLALLSIPIHWIIENPVFSYNYLFILSFSLSALAAYLLCFELTNHHGGSWIAGLAYGFMPYRIDQLGHLQVLSSYWMPLALLGLHLYIRNQRSRWLILFGLSCLLQSLSNGYYLLFFPVLIGLWLTWFIFFSKNRTWRIPAAIGGTWLLAVLPIVPLLLHYRTVHDFFGFSRSLAEIAGFSADVLSPLNASRSLTFWGQLNIFERAEGALFPGLTITLLIILAMVIPESKVPSWKIRSSFKFYLLAAGLLWIMALGPDPSFMGTAIINWAPYDLMMSLPGYDSLRVPSRFWMLSAMCLSVAAGLAITRITAAYDRKMVATVVLATIGILGDTWVGSMRILTVPPRSSFLEQAGAGPVLELPLGETNRDTAAMYRGIFHGRPVVNGYSGYRPPHYSALAYGLENFDSELLTLLANLGVRDIRIDRNHISYSDYARYVSNDPGVELIADSYEETLYRLPEINFKTSEPTYGRNLPIENLNANVNSHLLSLTLDNDRLSRWQTGHQQEHHQLSVDLGAIQKLGALILELGPYSNDFPRELLIEISKDGQTWINAWNGPTATKTFSAALKDPNNIPIAFPLDGMHGRYLRIRQTGSDPVFYWSITEISVASPANTAIN